MEGTLTRFSPEPRAAAHLPLLSGALVMQGDAEEKTDRRGDEKDWLWRQAGSILIEERWLCFSGR